MLSQSFQQHFYFLLSAKSKPQTVCPENRSLTTQTPAASVVLHSCVVNLSLMEN